jgi:steroid delta-isomerase-like uncharacterized protein
MRVRPSSLAIVAVVFLCFGCQPQPAGPSPDVEAMKALIERSMQAYNENKPELCDEVYAADFVRHTVERGELVGPDGIKNMIAEVSTGYPDIAATILEMVVGQDTVVTRWNLSGTHTGSFEGLEPTGKRISIDGVFVSRIADGMIVEEWVYYDALGLWQQLGYTLVPPAEEAAE